jgi:hypothetical protein
MYGDILSTFRKGQVWSYDLIVASTIFVMAMAVLAFFWWGVRTNMSEDKEAIIRESFTVSDLLMSPGIPQNWNTLVNLSNQSTWSNVQQLGLAESWTNSSLSIDKVYKLLNMSSVNYSTVQNNIRSPYNFYIQLILLNTSNNNAEQPVLMNQTAIIAGIPYNDATVQAIARDDRVVVYNNSIVIMRLYLWSNSTLD